MLGVQATWDPLLWSHLGQHRIRADSFAVGLPGPPAHHGRGLLT